MTIQNPFVFLPFALGALEENSDFCSDNVSVLHLLLLFLCTIQFRLKQCKELLC